MIIHLFFLLECRRWWPRDLECSTKFLKKYISWFFYLFSPIDGSFENADWRFSCATCGGESVYSCLIGKWEPTRSALLCTVLSCGTSPGKKVPRAKVLGGFIGGFFSVWRVGCDSWACIGAGRWIGACRGTGFCISRVFFTGLQGVSLMVSNCVICFGRDLFVFLNKFYRSATKQL